ncbi:thioredoxin family protein [Paludibacter sp.]|uniref:thioredoxin family protein n=1 Tax=Paludibacter sp. TaxID=1898105 RepID=UPI001352699A|nr:thioredoxin family protein [Paludibacter sp.]MTK52619.1 thioredoxin family protein [Paludibacter sp.]
MRKQILTIIALCFLVVPALVAQTSTVKQISDTEFRKLVWDYSKSPAVKLQSHLPVIIDFFATWCRPCKELSPSIERLQKEYAGKLIIYRVDVDKDRALAEKMNIPAMPTLIFINTKNQKSETVGLISYDELKQAAIQKLQIKK